MDINKNNRSPIEEVQEMLLRKQAKNCPWAVIALRNKKIDKNNDQPLNSQ